MEFTVQLEKPSSIVRKLTIKVPAGVVASHFERGLIEVQKTAKLKGFRPGQVPISVIKQYYGDDVRHRVYHNLIDESFQEAVRKHQLQAVGRPQIDSPDHKTGEGDHDHSIHEDQDLSFIATVEVLPEIEVKGYTGVSLVREKVEVNDSDVEKVVQGILDSQAQLVPASSGLAMADGSSSSRPVQKGDHVDMAFSGGVVTPTGIEEKPGMKGSRLFEIGSDSLILGFEDHMVGMRKGETKTFRIHFPKDFYETDLAEKEAEFTVTVNEVKEKKLPTLDDEFAKQMGYEGVSDFRTKVREYILRERTEEVDRKLRSSLIATLIEKNSFDVPNTLVESQTRALAQDWAEDLKKQGASEEMIREAITQELDGMRKRADSQVRASLILEAISNKEGIKVEDVEFEAELERTATMMKADKEKIREYYSKNPSRQDDLMFRLRQDRTLGFLLEKAKIKAGS